MKKLISLLIMVFASVAMCAAAFANNRLELVDTQQIPENRLFRSGYVAEPFEGKIILSDIRGSKKSSKPWIAFYGKTTDGKSIKFDLEFADGNIQVCALYKGEKKGLLDRKYLLRETLPANDKWRYSQNFTIEVIDSQAIITLGQKSYTWSGVSTLTGEMEVGRVSGTLAVYNYVRD